jgi:hypothetical protein
LFIFWLRHGPPPENILMRRRKNVCAKNCLVVVKIGLEENYNPKSESQRKNYGASDERPILRKDPVDDF